MQKWEAALLLVIAVYAWVVSRATEIRSVQLWTAEAEGPRMRREKKMERPKRVRKQSMGRPKHFRWLEKLGIQCDVHENRRRTRREDTV